MSLGAAPANKAEYAYGMYAPQRQWALYLAWSGDGDGELGDSTRKEKACIIWGSILKMELGKALAGLMQIVIQMHGIIVGGDGIVLC
ncbi:MAG: hypothetical protein N2V77_04245 [Canidatus Methanoxibalbensis ujae]|nr:hypothetical protein [Candidatus Methanoxibalbensis ujae]MCW7079032.1 hypothetical protein [Candidatus Methanoxibalbensis ujae]